MSFREDFVWGSAAAAFQIEGASLLDGKKPSVWDAFCQEENRVYDNHTGENACDHYNRYKEDVAMMKEMGQKAYRFSVSWPRILPNGIGEVNHKGIEFYSNLIDELLAADITPYMTLFHWDYPLELFYKGGWLNGESSNWFEEYARVIATHFGDRVKHFMPLNEPQIFMGLGYEEAVHAPGIKMSRANMLRMNHNVLLSHGKATKVLREMVPNCQIGVAYAGATYIPASDSPEDIDAAKQANGHVDKTNFTRSNRWWADPIILGKYPDIEDLPKNEMPEFSPEDMEIISQPTDFFGINIYASSLVRDDGNGSFEEIPFAQGTRKTAIGWNVTPKSLYWIPKFFYDRYKLPIYITENGLSCTDGVSADGKVHDPERIDYLRAYLLELKKVSGEGVDVRGYFQWSLMDNFEWAEGYSDRFGLVYINYQTQQRIVKDSGWWYKQVIGTKGHSLENIT